MKALIYSYACSSVVAALSDNYLTLFKNEVTEKVKGCGSDINSVREDFIKFVCRVSGNDIHPFRNLEPKQVDEVLNGYLGNLVNETLVVALKELDIVNPIGLITASDVYFLMTKKSGMDTYNPLFQLNSDFGEYSDELDGSMIDYLVSNNGSAINKVIGDVSNDTEVSIGKYSGDGFEICRSIKKSY